MGFFHIESKVYVKSNDIGNIIDQGMIVENGSNPLCICNMKVTSSP